MLKASIDNSTNKTNSKVPTWKEEKTLALVFPMVRNAVINWACEALQGPAVMCLPVYRDEQIQREDQMTELADQTPGDELALQSGAALLSTSALFPAGREGTVITGPRLLKGSWPPNISRLVLLPSLSMKFPAVLCKVPQSKTISSTRPLNTPGKELETPLEAAELLSSKF